MGFESVEDLRLPNSPETIVPSYPHSLKSECENGNPKGKPTCRDMLSLDMDFWCNNFSPHPNFCKSIPSTGAELESGRVHKRGSIYHSSEELSKMKDFRAHDRSRNNKILSSNDSFLPYRMVDPLHNLDEESEGVEHKMSLPEVRNSCKSPCSISSMELSFHTPSWPCSTPAPDLSLDGFFEIVLDLDRRRSTETLDIGSNEDAGQVSGRPNDDNSCIESEAVVNFAKALPKIQMPSSPTQSKSSCFTRNSSRAQSSLMRKMLNPFMKSKTPPGSPHIVAESDEITVRHKRTKIFQDSPLRDLLNMTPHSMSSSLPIDPIQMVGTRSSHLQGCLKLEHRHGLPFFKFSLKCPKEALVARTWKADNTYNWLYTFHSVCRRKSNSSAWGLKDSNRDSSMMGQMQVSRYSYRNIKDGGGLDNTLVTEFVLYDTARGRKGFKAKETPDSTTCYAGAREDGSNYIDRSSSSFKPWAPADLHPYLENAAIVIQFPIEKSKRMKWQRIRNKKSPCLLDLFMGSVVSQTKVNVVSPSGNHGLPSTENHGPLRLLDRWRSGGGCDCGGWDMGCPLKVLSNLSAEGCLLLDNGKPLQLFFQGAKEKIPALTMKHVDKEQYAVDYDAQLSTLQAFSICVAVLEGAEVSTTVGRGIDQPLLQNDKIKSHTGKGVKFSTEVVTEDNKIKATDTMQKVPPTFMVSPPFSPVSRV